MKTVIIAKDIKSIIEKDQSFLNRADIRTFTVSSNEQALALHRGEKADLIVVDLDSPEMTGEMLCTAGANMPKLAKNIFNRGTPFLARNDKRNDDSHQHKQRGPCNVLFHDHLLPDLFSQ